MSRTAAGPLDPSVAAFRRFNRLYTRVIGLLDEELLKSGHSLAEARVLFEMATRGESGAAEIAAELNLDAGYLSRILGKFEKAGLLHRFASAADARHSILRLTKKGKSAFAELDRRSAAQAHAILEEISPQKRLDLIRAMHTIEVNFAPNESGRRPFVLRPHRPGDMGWVISRHGVLYAQQYGWDEQFEALVARIAADFLAGFDPRLERCWIAEKDGEPLGCIFLVRHPERNEVAKLRLLLVEPSARGMGLGKALVGECVGFARFAGYKRVMLWTQSILHAAHHLYEHAGFKLVAKEPHHSFGKDLVGQTWELEL